MLYRLCIYGFLEPDNHYKHDMQPAWLARSKYGSTSAVIECSARVASCLPDASGRPDESTADGMLPLHEGSPCSCKQPMEGIRQA